MYLAMFFDTSAYIVHVSDFASSMGIGYGVNMLVSVVACFDICARPMNAQVSILFMNLDFVSCMGIG